MLTFLHGENDFALRRYLDEMSNSFAGTVDRVDGRELEQGQLLDLLMGVSLFQEKRLVIIEQLSENKSLWTALPQWLEKRSDDVSLVLVEMKPDKRTAVFKLIQKTAEVHEFSLWTQQDSAKAIQWMCEEAERQNVVLTKAQAQLVVSRVGTDQWGLFHAIQKLALVDEISSHIIDDLIDRQPEENVFLLFETALRGDVDRLKELVSVVKRTNDAYQTFGLLSTQLLQLVALVYANSPSQDVAKDIKAHPYVMSKLSHFAERTTKSEARDYIALAANTDTQMKASGADPWLLVEQFLIKIAR